MKPRPLDKLRSRTVSVGVTGFSRAGKTVFLGSVAQALLKIQAWMGRRGESPLAGFGPFLRGSFDRSSIRSDIYTDEPQFPFLKVRDALCGVSPCWPTPTEGLSRLVIDLALAPQKRKHRFTLQDTVRIEFIDYPGEWLVDLPMLEMDYGPWSSRLIERARIGQREKYSKTFFSLIDALSPPKTFDDELAQKLTDAWTEHLLRSAANGLVFNQPGRLLRPDRHAHSPILRLVPLPETWAESAFYKGMERRYKEYNKKVITPFYKKHFSRIDRQIVLVDLLHALDQGEECFNDMKEALGSTLKSFNYGNGGMLDYLFGRRTTHLLFAATKADHVRRADRNNLRELLKELIEMVDETNIITSGPEKVEYMAIASVCATEDTRVRGQPNCQRLSGHRLGDSQVSQWNPGDLPLDLPPEWANLDFEFMKFEPVFNKLAIKEGFQSINIDKTLEFLIRDKFP